MPHHGKNDRDGADAIADLNETLADALSDARSKVGYDPPKVGRKIVSQGKRRESLKKRTAKDPEK